MADDSDSDDDMPLAARMSAMVTPPRKKPKPAKAGKGQKASAGKPKAKAKAAKVAAALKPNGRGKGQKKASAKKKKGKKRRGAATTKDKSKWMWTTLQHKAVLFPPPYKPHGVKMLYDGAEVDLTPEQEEVMTAFAMMRETDYMKKPTFIKNAWAAMKKVLGKGHAVQRLEKCDFTPMWEWHLAEKERKKAMTKEEKKAVKDAKDAAEEGHKFCLVDDRKEQVGNFRVEPPGLFRGRGEHPKMGMWKRRVMPEEVTINIGEDCEVPECPVPGHRWGRVIHDHTVTWLASWNDPINTRDLKYVFLAANSQFKADSDLAKYEKARQLKDYIEVIRKDYMKGLKSKDPVKRQMACACFLIDRLALRAGHEKEEDEADTVGCCTLKVGNVEMVEPEGEGPEAKHKVKFDFLGKDSIRYENEAEVHALVHKNMAAFHKKFLDGKAKKPEDLLFDGMTATDINTLFKCYMPGLSAKVFRTYNASIVLCNLLREGAAASEVYHKRPVEEKKADYDRANKEVAILCNHQRSVPKGHAGSMQKLQEKLQALVEEGKAVRKDLKLAKKGEERGPDGKKLPAPEKLKAKLDKLFERVTKLKLQQDVREDLKTVALGTSKINYMDPRVTVSWCKRHEVPIEKVFNKSLLSKFHWAMTADHEYKF